MEGGLKRKAESGPVDPNKRHQGAPSKVLHVRGLPAFTTEQELRTVLAPYGNVTKILVMTEKHQGFCQMESVPAAQNVINSIEFAPPSIRTKPIYFQFSSRQEIEIKNTGASAAGPNNDQSSTILLIAVSNVTVPVTLDNIHQICKVYGEVLKIITFSKAMDSFQALVQMATLDAAMNCKLFLDGKDMFQGCCHLKVGFSKRQNLIVKQNNHKSRDFTVSGGMSMGMDQMGVMGGMMGGSLTGGGLQSQSAYGGGSPVVLVNKLTPDVTADHLFALFGVYGDVQRVKILYNKRDTAMIQFSTPQQASHAQQNLNGAPLGGSEIVVTSSKHPEVRMPRQQDLDEETKLLTQEYKGHPLHRFKQKTFINQKNVNAPSAVLHLANLPESCTEAELRELFGQQQVDSGVAPVVEFFKNSRRMAYVGMASVGHGVNALIALHGYAMGASGYPLRVSFSHKDPESLKNSDGPQ